MIERTVMMIEMEIVRNSFCSIKTLSLLNSLSHASDKASKLFNDNFKLQSVNTSSQDNLQWEYLLSQVENIPSHKDFKCKSPSVIECNMNHTTQQLIEYIMLLLKSGNEVSYNFLNLLLQKAETAQYRLFDGQIGAGLTILSFLDRKHATWFDLL